MGLGGYDSASLMVKGRGGVVLSQLATAYDSTRSIAVP